MSIRSKVYNNIIRCKENNTLSQSKKIMGSYRSESKDSICNKNEYLQNNVGFKTYSGFV